MCKSSGTFSVAAASLLHCGGFASFPRYLTLCCSRFSTDQILNSALPATVFAPNNAAFERIARELKTSVDSFVARPDIETIMKYHVVPSFTLRVCAPACRDLSLTELQNNKSLCP